MKNRYALVSIFLLLFAGATSYYLYHPNAYFIVWLHNHVGLPLQSKTFYLPTLLHSFLMNHFADGCWYAALLISLIVLIRKELIASLYIPVIILLPFILEILQAFHIVPGTFDWYDILTYFLVLLPFTFLYSKLKTNYYAKVIG